MNEVKFTLSESRKNKVGQCPIYLRFYHSNTELVYPTGERCLPEQWDSDKMKFRRSLPGYQQANEFLQLLRERLQTHYRKLRTDGKPITNDSLRNGLNQQKSPTSQADLAQQYEAYIAHCRKHAYKDNTLKSMGATLSRLRRWQRATGKQFSSHYTNEEHNSLLEFLYAEGLHPNSVGTVCKHLVTFFNYLRESSQRLHEKHAKITKESIDSERTWLNESELEKLAAAELPESLGKVRDAFLFQCYTGLRYSDLRRVSASNIQPRSGYEVITLIAEKSVSRRVGKSRTVEVPILPQAKRIINSYAGRSRLLPVYSNQRMNDYIKEACEAAGINTLIETLVMEGGKLVVKRLAKYKLVSTHVARHTYATLSLVKGVPLEVVSKALGHSRLQTTMIYAKIADEWKNQLILNAWAPMKKAA